MPHQEHEHISSVSENAKIWRYYSTSKFLSLIETGSLYFSRIDQFDDPFEGYAPVQNLKKEVNGQQNLKQNLDNYIDKLTPGNIPKIETRGRRYLKCTSRSGQTHLPVVGVCQNPILW